MPRILPFSALSAADLVVDAVYEGGTAGNTGDDPLSKLLRVGNQGGFRRVVPFSFDKNKRLAAAPTIAKMPATAAPPRMFCTSGTKMSATKVCGRSSASTSKLPLSGLPSSGGLICCG